MTGPSGVRADVLLHFLPEHLQQALQQAQDVRTKASRATELEERRAAAEKVLRRVELEEGRRRSVESIPKSFLPKPLTR